ncbi:MAG: phosphate signaling complex protein PhoU [Negativicutes bacterium]
MDPKVYAEKLAEIKKLTLEMGNKTVNAVKLASQALLENNWEIAARVRVLEKEVDTLYKQIDELCIAFIATQQPMGRDLRFLVSTVKIAPEIERIADYANNIAKKIQKKFSLEDMTPIESLIPSVDVMTREVVSILAEAMHCYEAGDAELAMLVHKRDNLVNRMNKDLFHSIVGLTVVNQQINELAMDFHTTVRYIERVADRACNIVESVYYAVTGYRFEDNSK